MGSVDPETHAEWVEEVIFFWDEISKINGVAWIHAQRSSARRTKLSWLESGSLGTRFYERHLTIPL